MTRKPVGSNRTCRFPHPALGQDVTPSPTARCTHARSGVRDRNARAARDRTNLHCPLFNVGSISSFPSHRAGVLLHEAWHHWQYKHGFVGDHPSRSGACTGAECDYYYFHGTGWFDFGTLDRYDLNPQSFRFHSPYQVEAEFLSDLAEMTRAWVPNLISQTARDHGNILLEKYFINRVGYRIGQPRPW